MALLHAVAVVFAAASLFPQAAPTPAPSKKRLTLEQTIGAQRVSFGGTAPAVAFARDGVHLELQRDGKTAWLDPRTKTTRDPEPADPAAAAATAAREAALVAALGRLPGFDEATAKKVAQNQRGRSADGQALLLEGDQDLYFFRTGSERASRLTDGPGAEENARLSQDGRLASFVRGNDLFLVETESGRERRLEFVTRGLLWSCGKLGEDGKPLPGYGK